MRKRFLKWLSRRSFVHRFSARILATRMVHVKKKLTPEHLEEYGWIREGKYWVEPYVKTRDKIWVHFEDHFYRVYHGGDRTFIALKDNFDWFDNYYAMMNDDIIRKIAGEK